MKRSFKKCKSRGQHTWFCDGCKTTSSKCPDRDKFRELRNTKKGETLYGKQPSISERWEI